LTFEPSTRRWLRFACQVTVYHLQAVSGPDTSPRVAALLVTPPQEVFGEFGEHGVRDLRAGFVDATGDVHLSWEPTEVADGYEIVQGSQVIAVLDASARGFVDVGAWQRQGGGALYVVRTIVSGSVVAWRLSWIEGGEGSWTQDLDVTGDYVARAPQ